MSAKLSARVVPQGKTPVHLRWMIRRDLPVVLRIERASFARPWNEARFYEELGKKACIPFVAEIGEMVVAFMVYEFTKTTMRLTNFAVDPEFRRKGIASQTIGKLIGKLSEGRRTRIFTDVRETNLPAQRFLRSLGFRAFGVAPGHFDDSGEDAYLFCYRLQAPQPEPSRPVNRITAFDF